MLHELYVLTILSQVQLAPAEKLRPVYSTYMASGILWRQSSVNKDLSEMMSVQERSQQALMRDAEWQARMLQFCSGTSNSSSQDQLRSGQNQHVPTNFSLFGELCPPNNNHFKSFEPCEELTTVKPATDCKTSAEEGKLQQASPLPGLTIDESLPKMDDPTQSLDDIKSISKFLPLEASEAMSSFAIGDKKRKYSARENQEIKGADNLDTLLTAESLQNEPESGDENLDANSCSDSQSTANNSETRKPRKVIRRHRMTKEEEARFAPELLRDLKGTTAAKSRKMSAQEHDVMLHKRRLRNRASAARSRDKQRKTISELCEEMEALEKNSSQLLKRAVAAEAHTALTNSQNAELSARIVTLREELDLLRKENTSLRSPFGSSSSQPQLFKYPSRPASGMHLTPSSNKLSECFKYGEQPPPKNNLMPKLCPGPSHSPKASSGSLRMPSSLSFNLSSDKLDSLMFSPLPRTFSFLERFFFDTSSSANAPNGLNRDLKQLDNSFTAKAESPIP